MTKLTASLAAYGSDHFASVLKTDIEKLATGTLPLHLGTSQGGLADDSNISASVIKFEDNSSVISAHVGVFFTEVIGGCSCGDDPLSSNAYCVLLASIDKLSALTKFELVDDS